MARVLFVQRFQLMQCENLAVAQLAAVLEAAGHACDVELVRRVDAESLERIRAYAPDVIGFSLMTIDADWVLEAVAAIRQDGSRAFVIAGGPHPTYFPDFLRSEGIDAINLGEGEGSLLELADALDRGDDVTAIRNLHVKQGEQVHRNPVRPWVELAELPPPNRDLYLKYDAFREQRTYGFTVTRGCPYECSFCFIHQWRELYRPVHKKAKFRVRPVEQAIAELQAFVAKVEVDLISFVDSTFNVDKRWTIAFLEEYGRSVGLPFTINIRPNLVDEDVVRAIAATGCCQTVRMGVEVGSERVRREVLHKHITNEQIYQTADLLAAHGVKLVIYTMYGLPGETLDDALETVRMAQKIRPFSISAQLFHPYPGLNVTKLAVEKGYLGPEDPLKLARKEYRATRSLLRQPEIEQVVNLLKLSVLAARFPLLLPLVARLVRLPANKLFDLIYMVSALLMVRKYCSFPLSAVKNL